MDTHQVREYLDSTISKVLTSLVSRPPLFFVLRFAFSIIHGNGRARKTGKAWSHPSREWCQVDARWTWKWRKGEGTNRKKQHTGSYVGALYRSSGLKTLAWSKILTFTGRKLTFGVYLLHIWISVLPLVSTHVMDETRPSPFFALFRFRILTETEEQKMGEAWEGG